MFDYGNLLVLFPLVISIIVIFTLLWAIYKWRNILYGENMFEEEETDLESSGSNTWKTSFFRHQLPDEPCRLKNVFIIHGNHI